MKLYLIALALILLPIVAAEQQSLGTYPKGENVTLVQFCSNCTYNNISAIVYTPDGSIVLANQVMAKSGTTYTYALNSTYTSNLLGKVIVFGYGDVNGQVTVWAYDVVFTEGGMDPASDFFTVLIWVLFIAVSIGLLYSFIFGLIKLATTSETIYGVLTSWSFFVVLIIVHFLGKSYLLSSYVVDLTGTFIKISAWSNVVLPMFGLIITMIKKSFDKKKPLSPQELTGRKVFFYG